MLINVNVLTKSERTRYVGSLLVSKQVVSARFTLHKHMYTLQFITFYFSLV